MYEKIVKFIGFIFKLTYLWLFKKFKAKAESGQRKITLL